MNDIDKNIKAVILLLILTLVTSCSQISTTSTDAEVNLIPGFDRKLTMDEIVIDAEYVGFIRTHFTCVNHWYDSYILLAFGMPILGCADPSFEKSEDGKYHCMIRMPYSWMTYVYEHEVEHCLGVGHAGENVQNVVEQDK